jgi:hypothetical protein
MIIERNGEEIIIRLPASVNTDDLQDFIGYTRYKERTSKSKATRKEKEGLAGSKIRPGEEKKRK